MIKLFRSLLIFFFCYCHLGFGQEVSPFFVDVRSSDRDAVFDQCVELLMGSKYFVQSLDKAAGIVQCKHVVEDKRLLSSKNGDRVTYNLLLRPNGTQGTRIYLQANVEERQWSGSVQNNVRYYKDMGVSDKQNIYDPLIRVLVQHFDEERQ